MIARNRAVFGCCSAPAVPPFQHKCNMGRGGVPATERPGRRDERHACDAPNPAPSRPGRLAEDALAAALVAAGHEVIDFRTWLWRALDGTPYAGFVREFNVGALLAEPRRFHCDVFHPASRLVVEVVGAAHIAGRAKLRKDNERTGLLTAAGLRVLPVNPEQAVDGSAVDLVVRAIGAKEAK